MREKRKSKTDTRPKKVDQRGGGGGCLVGQININFLEGNPRVRERGLDREKDEKKKEERGLAGIYNSPMSVWPVCTLSLVSKGERRDQKKKKSTDAFIRK